MIFYSDNLDGKEAPADSGFPTQFVNPNFHDEIGPEGSNFVLLDFGYPADNKYLGVSDGVLPEPSTFAIAGVGGLGMLVAYRRRRAKP
jgi:MYXO-CTERM domain-containing protein